MRLIVLLPLALSVAGQQTVPERAKPAPPSFKVDLKGVPEVKLPAFQRNVEMGLQPLRMGERRALPADIMSKGKWAPGKTGLKLWRLAIISPGAASLRVRFKDFRAGTAQVWVHNGKEIGGPYTGNGPFGSTDFWSHSVLGDRVVIEFASEGGEPPFTLPEISHNWME